MSTRSFIAKQVEADKYRVIYCHSNGYLTHNGALLLDHYNSPEKVDESSMKAHKAKFEPIWKA